MFTFTRKILKKVNNCKQVGPISAKPSLFYMQENSTYLLCSFEQNPTVFPIPNIEFFSVRPFTVRLSNMSDILNLPEIACTTE